jgi:hypothetical protein
MKIIDIGICTDNVDPKGIGRIRCTRYNDYVSQKERSVSYTPWSDKDPFVASPFLPNNINLIPQIGQSVKLINYNPRKDTVNQEYIAGPYTTMHDFNNQTYTQQLTNTTYGTSPENKPDLRSTNGKYKTEIENFFAEEKDFALYGKYGSDVLFTENGLQLRGGKLISKEIASTNTKEKLIDQPIFAKKSANLYLKKFPKKMFLKTQKTKKVTSEIKNLKYLIEYDIDSLSPSVENPSSIKVFVYKVLSELGDTYKTNFFNSSTEPISETLKLINEDNTANTPTFTATITDIDSAYILISDIIFDIHDLGLSQLNTLFVDDEMHPFYFRPSKNLIISTPANETEKQNKEILLQNIIIRNVGPSFGLIWSKDKPEIPFKETEETVILSETDPNSGEQTFSAIKSDKIYFLSTDLEENETSKTIPFFDLNKYEYTQPDYIEKIEPSTFSTVRGENLLNFLRALYLVLTTHRHNPLEPYARTDYNPHNTLEELFKNLEKDILNGSIRIN